MAVLAELCSLLMLVTIAQGVFMRPPYNDENQDLEFIDELLDIVRKSVKKDVGGYLGSNDGIKEIEEDQTKGVQKWTGHYEVNGKDYPMTLKADLDMQKGIIAGEGTAEHGSFSVAGTVKSSGKVTFYALPEKELSYTFTGMYEDGKITGKYSAPQLGGTVNLKQKGSIWEGTYVKGTLVKNLKYKMEDVDVTIDQKGKITGTGKDYFGEVAFKGIMDSNNNVEMLFHYLNNPANSWTLKGKLGKKEDFFKGTFLEKEFHGSFELAKM